MKILIILNQHPYDGTDVTWNALRLASTLIEDQQELRLFLMNDAVDLARESCQKPANYDQDLVLRLKELIQKGAEVKVCGSCMSRCGIHKNQAYFEGAEQSTMKQLASWVRDSDRVISF